MTRLTSLEEAVKQESKSVVLREYLVETLVGKVRLNGSQHRSILGQPEVVQGSDAQFACDGMC